MFIYKNTVVKLLFFILTLSPFFIFGQSKNSVNFFNWQKQDGLPSNLINAVEKDKLGFLWLATNDGLCRYDGPNSIKVYRQSENNEPSTNSLQSNHIRSLYCDSEGLLWIGTRYGGLSRFNPSSNEWKTFQHNPNNKNSLSNDEVLAITEDSEGYIWVGTEDGLNLFDKETETFTQFTLYNTGETTQSARAILSIMEDDKGWIWVGTWAGGLHLLLKNNEGNYDPQHIRYFQTSIYKATNNVWALCQDKAGSYWIGLHGGGLLQMAIPDNASNKVAEQNWQADFHTYKLETGIIANFGHNIIQAIHQDQFNNLWVGSAYGLSKIDHKFLATLTKQKRSSKLIYDTFLPSIDNQMTIVGGNILDIFEDELGIIWIGTSDGLSQFCGYANQFKNFNFLDEKHSVPFAPSFVVDTNKNIWIGMLGKGLQKFQIEKEILNKKEDPINNLILGKRVSTIYSPDERWLYIGTELGITSIDLITRETIQYPTPFWVKSNIQDLLIQTILTDQRGFIWFGSSVGLFRIDIETKSYTLFEPDKANPNSISDPAVTHIIKDSKGSIWIGTYKGLNRIANPTSNQPIFEVFYYNKKHPEKGPINNQITHLKEVNNCIYIGTKGGICRYNLSSNTFETFNSSDYNFWVRSIEEGTDHDVWVSTSEGIFNYNYRQEIFKIYNKLDGLKNTSYSHGCSYKDVNNNIYFLHTNGFTFFSPKSFLSNDVPPPVYITDVEIMNRKGIQHIDGLYENKIELNHDDYRISFNFAALNYNRADKNQYAYRLIGLDDKWTKAKFGTPLVYTNLKPKEYRLEIKASNNDGVWNNKGSTIQIIQHSPYWKTWWFRLLALVFVGAILYLFFIWYTINIRRHNQKLKIYNETLNEEIVNRKRVEQKLQEFNEELKRSNKDLEQFAYITSHDLKEPIRVISSFSSLLSRSYVNQLDEKGLKYIKFIDEGVKRMSKLVDSLLTYSIVGQKDTAYETIDLNTLIEGKVSDLSQLIKDKNAIVKIGELPEIIGHQQQIGMVFYNLINNALKFNKQNQPIVLVSEELGDAHYWKFSIKDNGIGIEPQYQEQIFGIFKRLHNKQDYEGTGIGLSVCMKIVQQHQGNIWLKSKFGEGTTFFFTIKKDLLPPLKSIKNAQLILENGVAL